MGEPTINGCVTAVQAALRKGDEAITKHQRALKQLEKSIDEAEVQYKRAGEYLLKLKDIVAARRAEPKPGREPTTWEYCLRQVGISGSRVAELMQLATGKKTLANLRAETAARVQKHRDRQAPLHRLCNGDSQPAEEIQQLPAPAQPELKPLEKMEAAQPEIEVLPPGLTNDEVQERLLVVMRIAAEATKLAGEARNLLKPVPRSAIGEPLCMAVFEARESWKRLYDAIDRSIAERLVSQSIRPLNGARGRHRKGCRLKPSTLGLAPLKRGQRMTDDDKPIIVVHVAENNWVTVHIPQAAFDHVRVLLIDERVPNDRVYELTEPATESLITSIIGDGPIGSQFDGRHKAIVAQIKAAFEGKPHHLTVVSKDDD